MLFTYKFVPHQMDKMQEFLDYIFFEVWCKAPGNDYDISVFDGKPELKELMEEFRQSDSSGGNIFISTVENIFYIFKGYSVAKINKLKQWYKSNNNIKKFCQIDSQATPITYDELEVFDANLKNEIKELFSKLYTKIVS